MPFGPLGPRSATVRPASDVDSFSDAQTWFKNCSAPNAADGTVPTASWFNWWIAMWAYCASQVDIAVPNDQTDDTVIWDIIQQAITDRLEAGNYTHGIGSVI